MRGESFESAAPPTSASDPQQSAHPEIVAFQKRTEALHNFACPPSHSQDCISEVLGHFSRQIVATVHNAMLVTRREHLPGTAGLRGPRGPSNVIAGTLVVGLSARRCIRERSGTWVALRSPLQRMFLSQAYFTPQIFA
jgi:hypothetical protein